MHFMNRNIWKIGQSASRMSCIILHCTLLFLQFHAVTYIITAIRVSIRNISTVMVNFVAKFANIMIVFNHLLIQFLCQNYKIHHLKHDGESLVEILSSIIVATAGLDNPRKSVNYL